MDGERAREHEWVSEGVGEMKRDRDTGKEKEKVQGQSERANEPKSEREIKAATFPAPRDQCP